MSLKDTYRLVRRLGGGGMGEVYEAEHARLAGRYAVKVLLPQVGEAANAVRRFQREAEIASSLRHPNIVQVIDFDQTPEGQSYLVMEMLEGRDLERELSSKGRLPLARVADIVDQAAQGLVAAHEKEIVHRDLKPANIFLVELPTGRELVKLMDFGISKVLAATTQLTAEATVMGTPQYMSPEQAQGAQVGPSTDQYALATIAREMLTGSPPFAADTLAALVYKIVFEEPPSFADLGFGVPPGVEAVLNRAMHKVADRRYGSVLEFCQELRRAVDAQPSSSLLPHHTSAAAFDDTAATPASLGVPPGSSPGSVGGRRSAGAPPESVSPGPVSAPVQSGRTVRLTTSATPAGVDVPVAAGARPWRPTLVVLGVLGVGAATVSLVIARASFDAPDVASSAVVDLPPSPAALAVEPRPSAHETKLPSSEATVSVPSTEPPPTASAPASPPTPPPTPKLGGPRPEPTNLDMVPNPYGQDENE